MIYKIDYGKEELLNLLSKYDIHAEPYVVFERKGVIKLIVQNRVLIRRVLLVMFVRFIVRRIP